MKKILVLVSLVGCVGCVEQENEGDRWNPSRGFRYKKDPRTNICFAFYDRGIATVDCEKVPADLIK